MDEILIEEKRYISSKQAAKLTGYAKDYIGQLCREGRVPARLVGRSWYVLEAAIQDHRFGTPAVEAQEKKVVEPIEDMPLSVNLAEPRYSDVLEEEVLPSINQLAYAPKMRVEEQEEATDPVEPLQDSWRSWFDRAEVPVIEEPEATVETEQEVVEEPVEENAEVNVPVRAIHYAMYQPEAEEVLPRIIKAPSNGEPQEAEEAVYVEEPSVPMKRKSYVMTSVQLGSVLAAALTVILAAVGSGYFDSYILSNKQVSLVAGISLYNK